MALTLVGPVNGLNPGLPGGVNAAYDLTAAAVINGTGAQTITAITAAAGAVVTVSTVSTANPFSLGQTVNFASVGGMTQINSVQGQILALGGASGAWTITTNINSSAFTAYTSGGTCASINPAILCAVSCQVGGAITLNDSNTVAAAAITNQIIVVTMTAGQAPLVLNWPCLLGITASAVTTGTFAITYS